MTDSKQEQIDALERAATQAIELIDRLPIVYPDPKDWPSGLAAIKRVLRGGLVIAGEIRREDGTLEPGQDAAGNAPGR